MKPQYSTREAEALDALLDHKPFSSGDLDVQDARLAQEIRALADASLPVNRHFYHSLQQKLQDSAAKRTRRPLSGMSFSLAGILGAAIVLALFLLALLSISLIPGLIGQPAPAATLAANSPTAAPSQTPALTPTPVPTTVSVPAIPTVPVEGSTGMMLKTALPNAPASVPVYYQAAEGEALTAENARSMAARLGVEGPAYQYSGETGQPIYTVSNGKASVLFFGTSNAEFTYAANYAPAAWEGKDPLPFAQQAQIATQWLTSRGLLDFPYQVETCPASDCVLFAQTLEGGTVYQDNPYEPRIYVEVSPAGQVWHVLYRRMQVTAEGSQAILSADEAWVIVKTRRLDPRVFFQTLNFTNRRGLKTWFRSYQPGQQVDLYGYATVLQPVDASQPAYVEVNGHALNGEVALAAQSPMNKFLHVWGVYQFDAQGLDWVDLQGWEISGAAEVHPNGTIASNNSVLRFKSETGEWYTLPDLPAGIAEGAKLSISGAITGSDTIEWSVLQTQLAPDENQQIGSLVRPGMPLELAATPAPALPDTGYQNGDRVRVQGTLNSAIQSYPDGRKELIHTLSVAASGTAPGWSARLVGDGAQGIERYHNLPVEVEGTYTADASGITITVSRCQPVWPDVRIQPYFGSVSEQTIAGKTVIVLTEDSGKQWVIEGFLQSPVTLAQMGWETGAQIAVEGYPAQVEPKQISGLPILHDFGASLLGIKGHTRENYQPQADRPQEEYIQETASELPAGAVEQAELVYAGQNLRGGFPSEPLPRLLLPMWRFAGHLPDGREFEILVLASRTAGIP